MNHQFLSKTMASMTLIVLFWTLISIEATIQSDKAIEIIIKNGTFTFNKSIYVAPLIPENIAINETIIGVVIINYDIIKYNNNNIIFNIASGNIDKNFKINNKTGEISVNNFLDYEKKTKYSLNIGFFDGKKTHNTTLKIYIDNINDNPPVFDDFDREISIPEEELYDGCLTIISAHDPDIIDKNAEQYINYTVLENDIFTIDNNGCLMMIKTLNCDKPNGKNSWEIIVTAHDDNSSIKSLEDFIKITINLIDINDNPPYLISSHIIWDENQIPGNITKLFADDNDSFKNSGPFNFTIDDNLADPIVIERFYIIDDILMCNVTFDREEKQEYIIPIIISDNGYPILSSINLFNVTIGDVNDMKVKETSRSVIIRYWNDNYLDLNYLYVDIDDDDDGWHLNDYHFNWNGVKPDNFDLNTRTGTIIPRTGITEGIYYLKFFITEESKWINKHTVNAYVNVTFKSITKIAYNYLKYHGENSICPEYIEC